VDPILDPEGKLEKGQLGCETAPMTTTGKREAAPRFDKLTMRGENRLEAVREQATVAALARRC
jgi:hypothetical protein